MSYDIKERGGESKLSSSEKQESIFDLLSGKLTSDALTTTESVTEEASENLALCENNDYKGFFNLPNNGWAEFFRKELEKDYFKGLVDFLKERYASGAEIYPPRENIFNCFRLTDRKDVKVVILGQDPYHQPNQAMGLSFSVPSGIKIPPSLVNILKEIRSDLGRQSHISGGDLTDWAKQGVLLLNSLLTVEKSSPMAHKGRGWETFTDNVIKEIGCGNVPCVFMLWGRPAASKAAFIDRSKHLVLTAPHPSPLSASSGFFGCKHFSAANDFLAQMDITPVSW